MRYSISSSKQPNNSCGAGRLLCPVFLRMNTIALLLERISLVVDKAVQAVIVLLSVTMVGVIGAQVFFRYVLNDSLFWSEELGRLCLVWLTFFGASVAYRRGQHIGVDVVTSRLPAPARKVAALVAICVCLAFFAVIAVFGWKFMAFIKFQTTAALGLPKHYTFVVVPIAGAVMFLHGVAAFARELVGGQR